MEEKKNNKKTYILITLGIIGALIITLGITYAYWRLTKEQTGVNVVNTDCFSIDFTGENDITLDKAYPLDDAELESFLSSAIPYHFTITNQCSSLASATINLESLNANADKQLDDEWIDAILYETDYHKKLNKSKKLTGNPNNDDNKVIAEALHAYSLKNLTLKANEQKEFNLLLYLDQNTPLSDKTQNASWNGKITLSADYKENKFANAGTLRNVSESEEAGMWETKFKTIKKLVIEPKISEKTAKEGEILYGPFNEGQEGEEEQVRSYVICDREVTEDDFFSMNPEIDVNCTGYLQGDGGVKLNSNSSDLFNSFMYLKEFEGMEYLDTSQVTNMSNMFYYVGQVSASMEENVYIDLSHFDTSSVTDMSNMFNKSGFRELDLSSFDTSSVEDMSYMFQGMSNLQNLNLSSFDTSNVKNMDQMFGGMSNIQSLDLSHFNTDNLEDVTAMFMGLSNLQELNLSNWNLKDKFATGALDYQSNLFVASKLNEITTLKYLILENVNTSSMTDMSQMFKGLSNIETLDLSSFNTSNVTYMADMFANMSSLQELDLSSFNTSNVTNMNRMFGGDTNLSKITYGSNFIHNVNAETIAMFGGMYAIDHYLGECPANRPNASVHQSWEGVSFDLI